MLYTTLLLAASAFSSFAAAQNTTFANGPCCSVDPNSVPQDTRNDWCQAERNTCPEVCGGFSRLRNGGNTCDTTTLNFTCVCSDGTTPNMSDYQQSVPGLMCRQWFDNCIAASGEDLEAQIACKSITCGNRTTRAAASSSAAASETAASTGGGDQASATAGSPSAASSSGAATALAIARDYGTPLLAGGMMAVFGFAL